MSTTDEINEKFNKLNLFWVMFLLSLPILFLIAKQAGSNTPITNNTESIPSLRVLIYIIAALIVFVSRYLKHILLSGKVIQIIQISKETDSVFERYNKYMMIILPLSAGIGVLGLTLYLSSRNTFDLIILLTVSAFSLLLNRPQKNEIINMINKP
jgi:hypothetical protein